MFWHHQAYRSPIVPTEISRGGHGRGKSALLLPIISSSVVMKVPCLNRAKASCCRAGYSTFNDGPRSRGTWLRIVWNCPTWNFLFSYMKKKRTCLIELCIFQPLVWSADVWLVRIEQLKTWGKHPQIPTSRSGGMLFPPLTTTKASFMCVTRPWLCSIEDEK